MVCAVNPPAIIQSRNHKNSVWMIATIPTPNNGNILNHPNSRTHRPNRHRHHQIHLPPPLPLLDPHPPPNIKTPPPPPPPAIIQSRNHKNSVWMIATIPTPNNGNILNHPNSRTHRPNRHRHHQIHLPPPLPLLDPHPPPNIKARPPPRPDQNRLLPPPNH